MRCKTDCHGVTVGAGVLATVGSGGVRVAVAVFVGVRVRLGVKVTVGVRVADGVRVVVAVRVGVPRPDCRRSCPVAS